MVDQAAMNAGLGRSVMLRPSREQARQVEELKARIDVLEKKVAAVEKAAKAKPAKAQDTD